MKIYTRTGDAGETSLRLGGRVAKDAARVEAYGTIDELNATLGLALALLPDSGRRPAASDAPAVEQPLPSRDWRGLAALIGRVQESLFELGADLATAPGRDAGPPRTTDAAVRDLERAIDMLEEDLPPLRNFILPGGSPGGAALHVARAVCRRAERRLVALRRQEAVDGVLVRYLNRLSDLLFVAARWVNHRLAEAESIWRPRGA